MLGVVAGGVGEAETGSDLFVVVVRRALYERELEGGRVR